MMVDSPDYRDDNSCPINITLDGVTQEVPAPCSDCIMDGFGQEGVPVPCFYVQFDAACTGFLGNAQFTGRVRMQAYTPLQLLM